MRLQGKTAIITGAGTGIGRGIALEFAKQGARVVVVGRRMEPLKRVVEDIEKLNAQALAVSCDVSDMTEVQSLMAKVMQAFGTIDILVNNAGVYIPHDALAMTEEEWNTVMSIDLKGVWLCSKAVIPQMLTQGKGKIINVSSIAGIIGFEQSAAYCAAKGAVINLTREMALDYAPKGIMINGIAPGVIESDMTKPMLDDAKLKQSFIEKTPVGRVGVPSDIGHCAVYLASDESSFVVGQTLVVDGGWTIR